jgi:GDP-4-dehydro-6-deoxy-D-mannose reductase
VRARLADRAGLRDELETLAGTVQRGDTVTWVHMAAMVSVPGCEKDPDLAFATNVTHALETVRDVVAWARDRGAVPQVLYVSSGHVYATHTEGTRAAEEYPVAPRSVYARTKLQAEQVLTDEARGAGFPLRIARVFGLIAPRQPAHYMLPGLIRRVRERNLDGVPGLSYHRDFLDSRDVCDRLIALALHDVAKPASGDVVNVCSGRATRLRDVVEYIARAVVPDEADALLTQLREAPGRPDDVPWIVGDTARLAAIIGSDPQRIDVKQTVRDAVGA